MYERRSWDDLQREYPPGGPNGTRRYFMPDDVPVLATADGVVRLTRLTSRGLSAVIQHDAGWATYYTHLAELSVAPDQEVVAGEPIGTVGHDPPDPRSLKHLTFELWHGGIRRGAVDPEPYLAVWRHVGLTAWSPPTVRDAGTSQPTEGPDPGLTCDCEAVEVAVRVASPNEAIEEEARLIERPATSQPHRPARKRKKSRSDQ